MTERVYGILMQVDSLVKFFSGVAYDWSMKYKNENKTEVTVKFVEEHIETCLGDWKATQVSSYYHYSTLLWLCSDL